VNRPARLNRTLIAVLGLLLMTAGALPAAIRFHWLPALGADRPLVPGTALPPAWVLYAAAAAGIVLALAGLRWLAAQLVRKPRQPQSLPAHGAKRRCLRRAKRPPIRASAAPHRASSRPYGSPAAAFARTDTQQAQWPETGTFADSSTHLETRLRPNAGG